MTRQELNNVLQEEAKKLLPEVTVTLRFDPPVYGTCTVIHFKNTPKGSYKHEFKYKNHTCACEYEAIKGLDRENLIKEIVEPVVKVLKILEMKASIGEDKYLELTEEE
ncbi:MAG: hypothetical protein IIZ78_17580 [Clostridiales bacterium]|nr:hypothetical protein [Clostridiales bacterium]